MTLLLLLACATHQLTAIPPGAFVLPAVDFGPHDDAQTEWWHIHARLQDIATGEPLDVFVGFVVERTDLDTVAFVPVPLGANPFHAAYVRLATPEHSWTADRESFPDFFSAGFSRGGPFHGNWSLHEEGGALVLAAGAGPVRTELRLTPTRAPTLPGLGGRVQLAPHATSMWDQDEGMAVVGRWVEGNKVRQVEGVGFAKHQWGRLYDPNVDGFEWFSTDLPDGRGLSIGWIHNDGMGGVPGTLAWTSTADGEITALDTTNMRVVPTRWWKSRRSGARWPVAWNVSGEGLDLVVEAERTDQELWVFPASMWAGPARFEGTMDGADVNVLGFAEQVGADAPIFRSLYRSAAPPGESDEPMGALAGPSEPAGDEVLVPYTIQFGAEIQESQGEPPASQDSP